MLLGANRAGQKVGKYSLFTHEQNFEEKFFFSEGNYYKENGKEGGRCTNLTG